MKIGYVSCRTTSDHRIPMHFGVALKVLQIYPNTELSIFGNERLEAGMRNLYTVFAANKLSQLHEIPMIWVIYYHRIDLN
jgi:hypothetical protein